ncbi:hypothetical protein AB990_20805 [Alkalihalobacillus pseudalcaliphilus]|nr:hypothetical protein AB990_20805 [Alkalihalobacillus pseudalcaliphilus]
MKGQLFKVTPLLWFLLVAKWDFHPLTGGTLITCIYLLYLMARHSFWFILCIWVTFVRIFFELGILE